MRTALPSSVFRPCLLSASIVAVLTSALISNTALSQCTSSWPFSCCSDLNGDEFVDQADLAILMADWGCTGGCCVGDIDFDGSVGQSDLGIFLQDYNSTPSCTGPRPIPLVPWGTGALPISRRGVAFADYDADGWVDSIGRVYNGSTHERRLYWNDLGDSTPAWTQGCLLATLPQDINGYSGSAGDLNNDGYPDYVNEPRLEPNQPPLPIPNSFIFLVNAGCGARKDPNTTCGSANANFVSAADCLEMLDPLYGEEIETNCYGDLDGDGDCDLFLPGYKNAGQHGNFFLRNTGTEDPNCSSLSADCQQGNQPAIWGMVDETATANLGTIPKNDPNESDPRNRPEGAQVVDYDFDGDLDVFVQDTVHQNITVTAGEALFQRLHEGDSGIEPITVGTGSNPEEGLLLADLDMDGDFDLVRNLYNGGLIFNRSRGDGTFDISGPGGLVTFVEGHGHGVSAADWDNDGDLDLTAGGNWHRNTAAQGWSQQPAYPPFTFLFEQTRLPDLSDLLSALPCWADVDRDGDLDCAHTGFGADNNTIFYRNQLHNSVTGCEESTRRYVNVRPVRAVVDSNGPSLPRNFTENEWGAKVELLLRDDSSGLRRARFTSSAGGYLTQNEYPVQVGLPPDPNPDDPDEDLHFDVVVDFVKPLPEAYGAEGPWRIDWTVNEALADINLAALYADPSDPNTWGRPITVYRDGRVRYAGQLYDPIDPNTGDPNGISPARMYTLCGPLLLPESNGGELEAPTSAAVLAGVRFTKSANSPPVRVREFVLDGQLDPSTPGCDYNLVVIDITDPNSIVTIGGIKGATVAHNRRTFIPIAPDPNDPNAFVLPQASSTKTYEVRVRATEYRPIAITDSSGLQTPLGISVGRRLVVESSSGKNICTEPMELTDTPHTTPVTVRLSRVAVAP